VRVRACASPAAMGSRLDCNRTCTTEARSRFGTRRGYCWWDVDHAGWVVTLSSPEEQTFYGKTLEEALAWCLAWVRARETRRS
jgi:hypothetical protein